MKNNYLKNLFLIVSSFTLLLNSYQPSYAAALINSTSSTKAEELNKKNKSTVIIKANQVKSGQLGQLGQSEQTEQINQTNEVSNQKTDTTSTENSADSTDSTQPQTDIIEKNYPDPYENYNRNMYSFNKNIDKYLIKPVAQLYTFLIPLPAKRMVTNFYGNIEDFTVLINDVLQGELDNTKETIERIGLNSTFGILGFIDVASDVGWSKRNNDYGVTFGKWGLADSPYFIIPIFGPSTVRDAIGRGIGVFTSPLYFLSDKEALSYLGLYMVDTRANLLTAEKIVDTVSDDEYVFIRNSYLEYRDGLVRGEKPNVQREANEENLIRDIFSEAVNDNSSDVGSNSNNNSANTDKDKDEYKVDIDSKENRTNNKVSDTNSEVLDANNNNNNSNK